MRNRSLHDALRDFALEAAALLTAEVQAGADLTFDVEETGGRRTVLYSYRPLTAEFIGLRWTRLRELPAYLPAARALGSGAAAYLRVRGAPGADAEPALRAMLERLYEDATGFDFPEDRFERVYGEVEATLYEHAMRVAVVTPVRGLRLESDRVDLGDGLALVRGDWAEAPPEAVWDDLRRGDAEPNVLAVLEEDAAAGDALPLADAAARFIVLQTALRLFKAGGVAMGPLAWARADGGAWRHVPIASPAEPRGPEWRLGRLEEEELNELLAVVARSRHGGAIGWALTRFEMGLERPSELEALSDHLLALGALLDAGDAAGRASLSLRLAALCAEEESRHAVRRRLEHAFALERWAVAGSAGPAPEVLGSDGPAAICADVEQHLRALLRDVLCEYLDPDLRSLADDILLTSGEPVEIAARDLRELDEEELEPEDFAMSTGEVRVRRLDGRPGAVPSELDERAEPEEGELEPSTTEFQAVPRPDPAGRERSGARPEEETGVTASADWDFDDDPESYSAPV